VPRAWHFLYWAPLDGSGSPDYYTYMDTVYPVNGRHPYTRDLWTGQAWIANDVGANAQGTPVSDPANRLSALDTLPPVLSR
jgi:hypothetical protein